jgi:molybdopterin converting factor small subunit
LIRVSLLGHIRSSVGSNEVTFPDEELDMKTIVERLRLMSKESSPGFSMYNIIAMIEDGEAFVPASASRKVKTGERVVIVPFSHGG